VFDEGKEWVALSPWPRRLGMGVLEIVIYNIYHGWLCPLWYNIIEFPLVYVREYRMVLIRLLA
jgi:hypothetical protein